MSALRVAVVILNWNGKRHLERFLPGVVARSPQATVYVADNASTDGSVEWVRGHAPTVHVIQNGDNLGYAGGYAKALVGLDEDILVLLNSDVEVSDGWLIPTVARFAAEPDLAALQPKILDLTVPTRFEYAGAAGGYMDVLGIPLCRGRLLDTLEDDHGQYDAATDVFWASGACLFVRATHYRTSGGLDPDLFAHMEEIDLCWRMQRCGYRVAAEPAVAVYHLGGGTLSTGSPFKTYLNFRNGLLIVLRNMPLYRLAWVLPLRVAQDVVAAWTRLFVGDTDYFKAVAKAHWHVLGRLISTWRKRGGRYSVPMKGTYGGILAVAYFLRGKRKFSQLFNATASGN
jgi:GT2 family glycosyltransferase